MTHLASTTADDAECPRCHKPILTALDEGLTAHVDATPLPDRQAEIAALIEGRWTYTLTTYRQLIHRNAQRITADTMRGTIHAEHRCAGIVQLTIDDMIGQT